MKSEASSDCSYSANGTSTTTKDRKTTSVTALNEVQQGYSSAAIGDLFEAATILASQGKKPSSIITKSSVMNPHFPSGNNNSNGANSDLQLLLELQRQQQQQQQNQQLYQQLQQLQQQQQTQQQLQTVQQQPSAVPGLQALLMQQRRQPQQQIPSPGLLMGLAGLGTVAAAQLQVPQQQPSSEIDHVLRQREGVLASQLLARQQTLDDLLTASGLSTTARAQQQGPQLSARTADAPLAALLAANPNDTLQHVLQHSTVAQPAATDAAAASSSSLLLSPQQRSDALAAALLRQRSVVAADGATAGVASLAAAAAARSSEEEEWKERNVGKDGAEDDDEDDDEEDEEAKVEATPSSSSGAAKADDSESDDEEEAGVMAGATEEDEEDHPANDTFPFKLHRMLEHAEKSNLDDVISFTPDGRLFAIHKPREFVASIMPKYFTTSRMSSFQRQLNLYGFRRITEGRDKGAYFHKFFLKGRRGLCKKVKRKKTSSKAPPPPSPSVMVAALDAQVQNSMSVRQLLAERQFGAPLGLAGVMGPAAVAAAASLGITGSAAGGAPPPPLDASQVLANAQLHQRLELLMRQNQEEERLQQEQQRRFPGGGPGPNGGGVGGSAGGFHC